MPQKQKGTARFERENEVRDVIRTSPTSSLSKRAEPFVNFSGSYHAGVTDSCSVSSSSSVRSVCSINNVKVTRDRTEITSWLMTFYTSLDVPDRFIFSPASAVLGWSPSLVEIP